MILIKIVYFFGIFSAQAHGGLVQEKGSEEPMRVHMGHMGSYVPIRARMGPAPAHVVCETVLDICICLQKRYLN